MSRRPSSERDSTETVKEKLKNALKEESKHWSLASFTVVACLKRTLKRRGAYDERSLEQS